MGFVSAFARESSSPRRSGVTGRSLAELCLGRYSDVMHVLRTEPLILITSGDKPLKILGCVPGAEGGS